MLSRLVGNTRLEHVDVPGMRSQSNQFRRSLAAPIGLYRPEKSAALTAMYLLTPTFRAVRALPNRSYAALKRGVASSQSGTGCSSSTDRAGTKRPAGIVDAEIPPWYDSMRKPGLTVRRLIVHVSCTYPATSENVDFPSAGVGYTSTASATPSR